MNSLYKKIENLLENKEYKQAITACEEALSEYPEDRFFLRKLAFSYGALCNYNKAIDIVDLEIELEPDYSGLYFRRGRYFLFLSEYALAEQDFEMMISLDGTDPRNDAYVETGYFFKAYAAIRQGKYDIASQCLQRVRDDYTGHVGDGGVQTKTALLAVIAKHAENRRS